MRSRILITSAAGLLAGTMFAFGQAAPERKEAPGASQQPGISQGQPGQPKSKATQGAQKEQPKPSTNGQAQENREQGPNREQGQPKAPAQTQRDQAEPRTQGQNQREQNQNRTQGQSQREPQRDQGQTRTPGQNQPGQNQPGQTQTQGQNRPSSGASVTLTTEQRTKIRQTVLEGRGAPRVDKVDFSLNVGTVVPRTVHVVEVPETIIEIHPEWRRFMYFVYNDEIIIVEPGTLKIVAIVEV
jgi:cell division protein FtsN